MAKATNGEEDLEDYLTRSGFSLIKAPQPPFFDFLEVPEAEEAGELAW